MTDAFSAWLLFSDFSVTPLHINGSYAVFTLLVTAVSMVDAAYCASRYNAKYIEPCPRCGAKNTRGHPACLLCGTPLSAAPSMPGQPMASGPPPPPPGHP